MPQAFLRYKNYDSYTLSCDVTLLSVLNENRHLKVTSAPKLFFAIK